MQIIVVGPNAAEKVSSLDSDILASANISTQTDTDFAGIEN